MHAILCTLTFDTLCHFRVLYLLSADLAIPFFWRIISSLLYLHLHGNPFFYSPRVSNLFQTKKQKFGLEMFATWVNRILVSFLFIYFFFLGHHFPPRLLKNSNHTWNCFFFLFGHRQHVWTGTKRNLLFLLKSGIIFFIFTLEIYYFFKKEDARDDVDFHLQIGEA